MAENSEPVAEDEPAVATLSHKRILTAMAIITVLGCIAGLVFGSVRFGAGVLIGGLLSFANYFWLKHSLKIIFDRAIAGDKPRFLVAKYFLRYVVFGLILTIVYLTDIVPIVAVILGIASFAFAVVAEGIMRIFSGQKREY